MLKKKLTFEERGQVDQIGISFVSFPFFEPVQSVSRLHAVGVLVPIDNDNLAQVSVHERQVLGFERNMVSHLDPQEHADQLM